MRFLTGFIIMLLLIAGCGESKNQDGPAVVTNIDSLVKLYPDSVAILVKHGNVLLERYDYDNALKEGAKAYRLEPDNVEARFLYALALNNRASRTATDVVSAQEHFKVVLKKQPKNTKALVALATTFSYMGDYDRSFQHINQALRIDKRYRDAYVLKGTNYLQLGKRDLAKSSYRTAIEQDPDFYEAYIFLGSLYQQENDPLSIEYFKSAVQLKPKSMDALYALAYGYQTLKMNADAQRIYRKMITVEPTFVTSYFQQGYIKQFQENPPELDSAMYFYETTLQKEPTFSEAWHNLGLCYVAMGEKSKALQAFSKALKYNPEFTQAKEEADKLR
ncbi:MAG: tetratricopeptide repeat protein [Fluviicola sp.]|nr:tetratricopeptide repeat protein [Fluviicola sp.]